MSAPMTVEMLWETLGGVDKLREFSLMSKQISSRIPTALLQSTAIQQSPIYAGMGLLEMLTQAAVFKTDFDNLGHRLAAKLVKEGIVAEFIAAPVQGIQSSMTKLVSHCSGDCCKLCDCVRGTIKIKSNAGSDALQVAYLALLTIVDATMELEQSFARFVSFDDGYQKPPSTYSAWTFMVEVMGFICELQVNLEEALEIKDGEPHLRYERNCAATSKLLEAAMRGDVELSELLIDNGADVNCTDQYGFTPLHYAARYGDQRMMTSLLRAGSRAGAADSAGCLPLYHAVLLRHRSVAEALVTELEAHVDELCDSSDNVKASLQRTWVVAKSRFEAREINLASRIADLVRRTQWDTHMRQAIAAESRDTVALQALFTEFGFVDEWHFDWKVGLPVRLLDSAVLGGSSKVVQLVLAQEGSGFDSNGPHAHPFSSALEYVKAGKISQLTALLEAAPELSAETSQLAFAGLLECALTNNTFDVAKLLIDRQASLTEAQTESLQPMLVEVAMQGRLDIVTMLLQIGMSANATNRFGVTALHCAAGGGFDKICELLIESEADMNLQNRTWQRAVHFAACHGRVSTVELLVKKGADIGSDSTVDFSQQRMTWIHRSPAGLAMRYGHLLVLQKLAQLEVALPLFALLELVNETGHAKITEFLTSVKVAKPDG